MAEFDLVVNFTKQEKTFFIPDGFDPLTVFSVGSTDSARLLGVGLGDNPESALLSDGLTRLQSFFDVATSSVQFKLIVAKNTDIPSVIPPDPNPTTGGELYLMVHAVGELAIPGYSLTGGFDIFLDKTRATMVVHALMELGFGVGELRVIAARLEAIGVLQIDAGGLVGKLRLNQIDETTPPIPPSPST